jgi:quinoprotein dehydrogenase-associated probable ABC transporter substrate-binding protein
VTRRAAICAASAGLLMCMADVRAQPAPDLVSRTELRVCADPANLPFSNEKGEGFENKIATLVAHDLSLPLAYTWYPDSQGFVRATLMRHRCDVIIGTAVGNDDLATTNPYYRTGYVMLTRAADDIATARIGDPAIATRRFGLVAATPPSDSVIAHNLMDQVKIYPLVVDTRREQPGREMVQDLAAGRIDVALLWGPIAGFYAAHSKVPLHLAFLDPDGSAVPLAFSIAMGVRPGDHEFRANLNGIIAKDADQFTQILHDYDIPLLDARNHPLPPGQPAPPAQ